MRDRGKILIGLAIFLALATFPIWYNQVSGGAEPYSSGFYQGDIDRTIQLHVLFLAGRAGDQGQAFGFYAARNDCIHECLPDVFVGKSNAFHH